MLVRKDRRRVLGDHHRTRRVHRQRTEVDCVARLITQRNRRAVQICVVRNRQRR